MMHPWSYALLASVPFVITIEHSEFRHHTTSHVYKVQEFNIIVDLKIVAAYFH